MARYELRMPKMGESIIEATILKWVKGIGDQIDLDDTIVEIATDKVDSEVPSPVEGKLLEILFVVDDVVPVGDIIAIIGTEGEEASSSQAPEANVTTAPVEAAIVSTSTVVSETVNIQTDSAGNTDIPAQVDGSFFSPLVRSIAKEEGIGLDELKNISGTGANNRVSKADILAHIKTRSSAAQQTVAPVIKATASASNVSKPQTPSAPSIKNYGDNVEIVEMDRMRKMIAKHMVNSKQTSPHVTSFVEADMTNIFIWRNKVKNDFLKKHGQKITFTPIIIEAIVKAIKDFPAINISVDGDNIIYKKNINIGMAAALPSGNLIVPVIHNADQLNLLGLTKAVNDLAVRARSNQLKPEDIQGGTYTMTNVGTFGNVFGTPIINQPQVAIMAAGAIRKKPAVLETEFGDVIAIRNLMFLSHSYDHRVVDGFLGGTFVKRVAEYLESFDVNREI